MGVAFGSEIHDLGIDIILAPALNIHRNPLGGRNFEYFSEDPFITGNMTAALVKGIQSNGVGTSIKHFAANNEETDRNTMDVIVSERALREIFLKGFEIALFGNHAYKLITGGTGSGEVNKAYTVPLSQGIADAALAVDEHVKQAYDVYLQEENAKRPAKTLFEEFVHPTPPIEEFAAKDDLIKQAASEDDVAIIYIGRNAGEGRDRKVENDFTLSKTEQALIKSVSTLFHAKQKKVVVVLNIGGVIEVASWRDNPDAILLAWQPGLEGGHAIADLLSGKANPSGKLATTFPMKYEDVPSASNFPGTEFPEKQASGNLGIKMIPAEVKYEEGVYVGYRYYDTYKVSPAYEFGYGLSYTNFKFSDLKLSASKFNGKLSVSCTVTNTGKVAGKEVVQLYVGAPMTIIDKPVKELKGFAKTGLLQPGKSQRLSFNLTAAQLASFQTQQTSWIADPGAYTVMIGASSRDIRLNGSFTLDKAIVVEKVNPVLGPRSPVAEFKGKR